MAERKKLLLRLDPAVYDAVARWAADDLRSVNAQIEFALRLALKQAGRSGRESGRWRAGAGGTAGTGGNPGEAANRVARRRPQPQPPTPDRAIGPHRHRRVEA